MKTKVMSTFWMAFAAVPLAFAWLLPNHVQPWLGFHGDAWCATMMLIVAVAVLFRTKFSVDWHWLPVVVAVVTLIPLVQYAAGLVPMFGTAWINFAFLLGFLLALLVGAIWEKESPGQVGDFLFLAVSCAAIASFGLQLSQLFNLEPIGPWTLQSSGTRHYGNMAQPNQLASLLLLGLLGSAWGYSRKLLNTYIAVGIAAILLLGIALTESRTGWLNIALLVVVFMTWHKRAPSKAFLWIVLGLAIYFVVCVKMLPVIYDLLYGEEAVQYRSAIEDPRWAAWGMFFRAATHRPWFGFGWGQLGQAQFLMLDEKMWLGASMLQSHNIILDLILWNGFVIGLAITAFLIWWCWSVVRKVNNLLQLILMSFVLVLGTHAMLEYPLQYAYFLLPIGLIMGCLNTTLGLSIAFAHRKWLTGAVLMLAILVLAITIRDYLRVETSFYGLRYEHKKIETPIPRTPPDVLALTHFHDYLVLARTEPRSDMSGADIAKIRDLVSTIPSAFGMYRLASMLAMNGRPTEAQVWLRRMCQVTPAVQCEAIKTEWATKSLTNKSIAAVSWPVMPK
jgi:hypothetical protein